MPIRTQPRILGIVGSEQTKFTLSTQVHAYKTIRSLVRALMPDKIVSGGCHLGGVDTYAREIAYELDIPFEEYRPACFQWSTGYKPRNLKIAHACTIVICVVPSVYPPDYTGMRFDSCYHCGTTSHIKSGGCWTVKQAIRLGKRGWVVEVID